MSKGEKDIPGAGGRPITIRDRVESSDEEDKIELSPETYAFWVITEDNAKRCGYTGGLEIRLEYGNKVLILETGKLPRYEYRNIPSLGIDPEKICEEGDVQSGGFQKPVSAISPANTKEEAPSVVFQEKPIHVPAQLNARYQRRVNA